jgi:hypothetical protein
VVDSNVPKESWTGTAEEVEVAAAGRQYVRRGDTIEPLPADGLVEVAPGEVAGWSCNHSQTETSQLLVASECMFADLEAEAATMIGAELAAAHNSVVAGAKVLNPHLDRKTECSGVVEAVG